MKSLIDIQPTNYKKHCIKLKKLLFYGKNILAELSWLIFLIVLISLISFETFTTEKITKYSNETNKIKIYIAFFIIFKWNYKVL